MTQQIIVDGDEVKVIDVGPPGPPGIGNSFAPKELLPLTLSRLAPWSGWLQFADEESGIAGFPTFTQSYYGKRQALTYASWKVRTIQLESTGFAPMLIGDGLPVNFSICAFGLNYSGDGFPPGYRLRITAQTLASGPDGTDELILIGSGPLYISEITGLPTEAEFLQALEDTRLQFTFTVPTGNFLLGLEMELVDADGEPMPPSPTNTLALGEASMWRGSPTAKAVVNADHSESYLGMQVQTIMMTRYYAPVIAGNVAMDVAPGGFSATFLDTDDDGVITATRDARIGIVDVRDDDDNPVDATWEATSFRVSKDPTHPHDVVRLGDLDDSVGGLKRLAPTFANHDVTMPEWTDPGIAVTYRVDLGTEDDYNWAWENVAENTVATPLVILYGPKGPGSTDVTIYSANGGAQTKTVNPGEIYLVSSVVTHKSPAEDPDLGVASVEFYLISKQEYPSRVPNIGLSRGSLDGDGKIPINYSRTDLGDAGDGTTLEFVNPGVGRYAEFDFGYSAGVGGLAFPIDNSNHYAPGWGESPGLLTEGVYYRWRVRVEGTESGPPVSDFLGIIP